MPLHRRALLALAIATAITAPAKAQKLPAGKPIRIVVPYAAGGTTDVLARVVATRLAEVLGQAVIVENKPGGGGTIAGAQVAAAPADGLTLLLGGMELATAPSLVAQKNFVPTRDLAAVASLSLGPLVLVVNPQHTPVNSLAELIALARSRPDGLTFASAGNGNVTHLFGEIFKRSARLDMRHVPYRGAAPALTDLQGGQVTMMVAGTAGVRQLVAAGTLRALAVTGRDAAGAGVPGVPTFLEAGLAMPETDAGAWTALFAPKDTPRETITQLSEAVRTVLSLPELRTQFAGAGLVPQAMTPQALQAHLVAQTAVWTQVITQAGIKTE
ncbi:Bug family tripartite tricarboxylate transporter substrate binding protein [Hydrogenophaga sp.]|jgi:tripartite-type tricarboxylate transporter receptor subunit TctC|uniref:Bug family tripartite tricarboxylate transporter substrate binding protein n=1 Tax=Hydrogenophaga sp. TaxID=1904254 RepID=UPI003F72023A